jgi:hypothetical protein
MQPGGAGGVVIAVKNQIRLEKPATFWPPIW